MGNIYRNAEIVTIWAGTGNTKLQESLPKLEKISMAIARCGKNKHAGLVTLATFSKELEQFVSFFKRPWFTRTWVLQETLLAKDTRLVCGITVVPNWMRLASCDVKCGEEAQSSPIIFRMQGLGQRVLRPFGTSPCLHMLQRVPLI